MWIKEGIIAGIVDHRLREGWRCKRRGRDEGCTYQFMDDCHRSSVSFEAGG